jgi:hypothetical protein
MVVQKPTEIDLEQLRCARDRGPELPRLMSRLVAACVLRMIY